MSNILVIKHGSLGDIAQACGAIQDISENHKDDEIHLLTTKPYFDDRSDKLSFRPKETTNIKIESYRRIKPNLNEAIASRAVPDTHYSAAAPAPATGATVYGHDGRRMATRFSGYGKIPRTPNVCR